MYVARPVFTCAIEPSSSSYPYVCSKVDDMLTLQILTIIIGATVAWVASQQYFLAREKFKLDLFEKRFAVYKATQQFLSDIFAEAKLDSTKLFEFRRDTQDAVFLFGDEIVEYLKTLDRKALQMRTLQRQFEPLPVGEERSRLCEEEGAIVKELSNELSRLSEVFSSYLKFRVWKSGSCRFL